MRNQTGQLILPVENNPVRTRRTARKDIAGAHDGVLIVLTRDGEVESLVVMILVRVVVVGVTGFVQLVAFRLGSGDGTVGVAVAATGICA